MEKVLNLFTRFVKEKSLKIVFCLSNMILISTPHCVENSQYEEWKILYGWLIDIIDITIKP